MPAIFFLTLPPAGETFGQAEPTAAAPVGTGHPTEPAPFEPVFERLKASALGNDPFGSARDPRG
jgi:hypothetical protein